MMKPNKSFNNNDLAIIFVFACEDEFKSSTLKAFNDYIWILGIGKVNASFNFMNFIHTNLILKKYKKVWIINIGSAGAIKEIKTNCQLCNHCYFHDVNLTSFGYDYGQMANESPKFYSTSNKLNQHIIKCLVANNIKYEMANIATGDKFIDNVAIIKEILNVDPNIRIVDMEAAAIAHICYKLNFEFASIKFVSDDINQHNNHLDYTKFCQNPPEAIEKIIKYFINNFLHINKENILK